MAELKACFEKMGCTDVGTVLSSGNVVFTGATRPESSLAKAIKSGKQHRAARISFATPELLWKVLTAKRWELLKALCGAGPVSIREAARRVERDVKGVHGDVIALIEAGLLNRTGKSGVEIRSGAYAPSAEANS